jgi:hypothetical protein
MATAEIDEQQQQQEVGQFNYATQKSLSAKLLLNHQQPDSLRLGPPLVTDASTLVAKSPALPSRHCDAIPTTLFYQMGTSVVYSPKMYCTYTRPVEDRDEMSMTNNTITTCRYCPLAATPPPITGNSADPVLCGECYRRIYKQPRVYSYAICIWCGGVKCIKYEKEVAYFDVCQRYWPYRPTGIIPRTAPALLQSVKNGNTMEDAYRERKLKKRERRKRKRAECEEEKQRHESMPPPSSPPPKPPSPIRYSIPKFTLKRRKVDSSNGDSSDYILVTTRRTVTERIIAVQTPPTPSPVATATLQPKPLAKPNARRFEQMTRSQFSKFLKK